MRQVYYRVHTAFWSGVRELCLGLLRFVLARPIEVSAGSALVVSPHQDDETLGCGGLIALKRERGTAVHVAFLTDGSKGCGEKSPWTAEQLVEVRQREAVAALGTLGVPPSCLTFLGAPDGMLALLEPARERALVAALEGLLHTLKPDEVYLPYRRDMHDDHKAAHRLVLESLRRSGWRPEVWQYPIWALQTAWRGGFRWSELRGLRYLRVDQVLDRKRLAIAQYRSQVEAQPPLGRRALPVALLRLFFRNYELYFPAGGPKG